MQERRADATLTPGRRRALLAVGIAAAVVALDQATTSWALADLHRPVRVLGPLGLGLAYNSGTAFSLLSGAGIWVVPVVVAVLVAVGWVALQARRTSLAVAYGLVLGGALGNVADRVGRGHHGDVVDFITLTHWPTFNVADACITAGVAVMIVALLVPRARERPRRGDPAGRSAAGDPGSVTTAAHDVAGAASRPPR